MVKLLRAIGHVWQNSVKLAPTLLHCSHRCYGTSEGQEDDDAGKTIGRVWCIPEHYTLFFTLIMPYYFYMVTFFYITINFACMLCV